MKTIWSFQMIQNLLGKANPALLTQISILKKSTPRNFRIKENNLYNFKVKLVQIQSNLIQITNYQLFNFLTQEFQFFTFLSLTIPAN